MKFQKAISVLSAAFLLCMVFCPVALLAQNRVPAASSCHGESHPEQEEGQPQTMRCCLERAVPVTETQVSLPLAEVPHVSIIAVVHDIDISCERSPRYTETGRFLASVSVLRI